MFRSRQTEILAGVMERYGIDTEHFPPVAVMMLITSVSQVLVMEEALGVSAGHPEMRGLVDRYLDQFETGSGRWTLDVPAEAMNRPNDLTGTI